MHLHYNIEFNVEYQHVGISVSDDTMSISFVLHVVNEACLYNISTHAMINTINIRIKEKPKGIIRNELCQSFDTIQYHKDIRNLYSNCTQ